MISQDLEISLNLAVSEAAKRGHEYVTIEHILFSLLQNDSALKAMTACGGSVEVTRSKLEDFFAEHIPSGILRSGQMPQPTIGFQRVIQRAAQHVRASGKERIRGENILISMFSERDSFAVYILQQQNITRFDVINFVSHGIGKNPAALLPSDEKLLLEGETDRSGDHDGNQRHESADDGTQEKSSKDPLAIWAVNLNELALAGKIDPLIGRDDEIDRCVQILCRRRKNNPLLVGDPGVGKTAIAEGLAWKITQGNIPDPLKNAVIFSLDMGSLLAGTKFRGDFEQRLKSVVAAIRKRKNAILFIDEIHTIVGAGQVSGGTMDASNLLKPALSNGEVRCIGSTTFKEFRQHFETDAALSRRFQKIDVEEPSAESTVKILKGLKDRYEVHHNVKFSDDVLKAAVDLSIKYLRDKKLPDKAIDVMDEVGASFALRGHAKDGSKPKRATVEDVQQVIAKIARVPAEKISNSARKELQDLAIRLKKVVFGQDQAVDAISEMIKMSRSGLGHSDRPIGTFMFAGPTGVGKTEVAKQLANVLGIEVVRFDMSEYMERHAVSRMIGAPPGYVGFEQGGLLTEAINKSPHAVLLFDEIEKAHPDMQNILLQVFDHGTLTDNNGRKTDFRNTIIIMTTNAGARELLQGSIGFGRPPVASEEGGLKAVKDLFSPEFRNRLDAVITFQPLARDVVLMVVDKFLDELKEKLLLKKITFSATKKLREWLAATGYDIAFGARPLARLIQDRLTKPLANELLFGKLSKSGGIIVADLDKNEKISLETSSV